VKNGHQVSIVTLTDKKGRPGPPQKWTLIALSRSLPLPLRIPWTVIRIAWAARDADIVFANGLHQEVAISRFLVRRPAIAKIVGDPVWERYRNRTNSTVSIEDFTMRIQTLKVKSQRKLLSWSLDQFVLVTAPSSTLINLISNWGVSAPKHLVQNGTYCTETIGLKPVYDAITVSRLVQWKNLNLFIEAAAIGNFKIAICGDGPEKAQLETIARKRGANVTFLGELSPNQVQIELARSKCFVNISSYEGLSFSLIEAMMGEKTCIVSNIQGNTSVIEDQVNGLVIPEGSVPDLVNSIKFCLSNPEKCRILGKNARRDAENNFCEEKQIDKMMMLILGTNEKNI